MKVVCLECGTDYDAGEAAAVCPSCRTPMSQFVHVPTTPGGTTKFEAHRDNVTPLTDTPRKTSPTPESEIPAPEKVGKYEILGRAGAGGMGVVYKARDRELDRIVALKVMIAGEHATAETIQRFQREAKSAARLGHPNIVHVYDVGVDPTGLYYFAMEYIDGSGLDKLIKDQGFEPKAAARVCQQLASALQYAHEQGIIHRDLKPANVMVDRGGTPRLTDFGLAKSMADEQSLTRPGEIMGTACYMPPEQACGMSGVDTRSDIYSLGAVLYEMLTRRPPFVGETVVAILRRVEEDDPEPPTRLIDNLPRDLETICLKAMAKEKERRYATAGEMSADLQRFIEGQPIAAQRSSIFYRSTKWARRNPAAVTAMLMTVAGVALFAFLLSRPGPPAPPRPPPVDPGPDKLAMRKAAEPFYRQGDSEAGKARRFRRAEDRANRQEVYRKAQALLDRAIEAFPEYADAYYLRGVIDLALNQHVRAMEDFDKALHYDPAIADAYYERVMLRLREVEQKIVRGLLFTRPEDASELFAAEKKLVAADIASIRKIGIKLEKALVAEAYAMDVFRDEGDAIARLDEALQHDPTFADALVLRAILRMKSGEADALKAALEDLNAAVSYDANNQKAYKVRAGLHLQMERPEAAMKDLDEMVAIAPDEGQSYLDRAIVLMNREQGARDRRRIKSDLEMAVKLDPKNPTARFLDAVSVLSMPTSMTKETVQFCRSELEIAIAADPGYVPAHAFRMVCDQLLFDEAALKQHCDEFDRRFESIAQKQRDRVKNGVTLLANAIRQRLKTSQTQMLFDQGCDLLAAAEHAEAEKKFRDVLERLRDPLLVSREGLDVRTARELRSKAHYNLGCVHSLRRELDAALVELEAAFKLDASLSEHVNEDQDLEALRDDPRFARLVKRYRKE
jgi:tetratricopeptide (TPR) repeat protein/tRNA A-37 threonylcarbamoyl transferase component Bud32